VSRTQRQFRNNLRKEVIRAESDLTDADIEKKVNALKNEHDVYDVGSGELTSIYEYVWDKDVLGVDRRKYGQQLEELFDDCDVVGNLAKQHKLKVGSPARFLHRPELTMA
jgi:hypothetical protein